MVDDLKYAEWKVHFMFSFFGEFCALEQKVEK